MSETVMKEELKLTSVHVRKARTSHVCCECLGLIERGEDYEVMWQRLGNQTFKTCLDCVALAGEVWPERERREMGKLIDAIEGDADRLGRWLAIGKRRGATAVDRRWWARWEAMKAERN